MAGLLSWLLSALVGVVHVHHEPSHDSDAPFESVLAAAFAANLDFLVLTDHAPAESQGTLPAAEHAGIHTAPDGRRLLVLVGVEVGTPAGHLLALDVPEIPRASEPSARGSIAAIHALGGFAVVPHPFSHGGWSDWDAPFDGIEIHNNASELRRLGIWTPLVVLLSAWDADRAWRRMLTRPDRALAKWDALLETRRVVGFSGADAHQNVSILGWQLDPYERMFSAVQTVCPQTALEERAVWDALRHGRCFIRYSIHAGAADAAQVVELPSGRREHRSPDGRHVLEIHQPPALQDVDARKGPQ